ncbi:hypothetical protein OROMI_030402 [Orobanche minor]
MEKSKSDREMNWDKVFDALAKSTMILQKDRELLVNRVKSLQKVIYRMKLEQKVQSTKAVFLLSLKDRDAINYKRRYENTCIYLDDAAEVIEYLCKKCVELKDTSDAVSNKAPGSQNKTLQNEVNKLKSEIAKINLDKSTEHSALVAEKNFAWNQFKLLENNLSKENREKEKLKLMLNRSEVSNKKLKTDLAKMESESLQKSEEILRLSKEIEVLRSRTESATPLLRPCMGGYEGVIKVKREADSSQNFAKMARIKQPAHKSTGGKAPRKRFMTERRNLGPSWLAMVLGYEHPHAVHTKGRSSSSKRKAVEVITIPDSPKLFNSSFRVPKLRHSSISPKVV